MDVKQMRLIAVTLAAMGMFGCGDDGDQPASNFGIETNSDGVKSIGIVPQEASADVIEFAQKYFDAIKNDDTQAFSMLWATLEDMGQKTGQPLVTWNEQQQGVKWSDYILSRYRHVAGKLTDAGPLSSMKFTKVGKVFISLPDKNDFIGKIYVELTIGSDATSMALEITSTQISQRGRVLTDGSVTVLPWILYQTNILNR